MATYAPSKRLDAMPHDHAYSVDLKEVGRRASDLAERAAILDMLVRTLGNKKECAQRLGISYKALLYKIRDFGIAGWRPDFEHAAMPTQISRH